MLYEVITLENYQHAWSLAPFGQYYLNTIFIVILILAVQLVTIILSGYAFANYQFFGKRWIFFFVLLQMMIPTSALLAPNFSMIRTLGLFDTVITSYSIHYTKLYDNMVLSAVFSFNDFLKAESVLKSRASRAS